jgi:hypothetical protein
MFNDTARIRERFLLHTVVCSVFERIYEGEVRVWLNTTVILPQCGQSLLHL